MALPVVAAVAAAVALSLAGLLIAWRAWRGGRTRGPAAAAALCAWAASTGLWILAFGAEIGIALALESGSLLAFVFLLTRIEHQPPRAARERPPAGAQPAFPPARRGIALAYTLLAGPLAFAAALSLGLLMALEAPFHEQTRLILGGLAVPSLWAGMIIAAVALRRPGATAMVFVLIIGTAMVAVLAR
ncbi:hypothetical protein [Thauera linaloolentis]|uniref:Uncharacterized protein n=1 Tax=Thauera linaloolentis (strain DSM 12138 / JCM 21573 / CCUG 41526 / CIP 105981 / IAM 15112 / NBRC 102519 / 47Lol) TaxID=1123367 RepID=N6Y3H0_THAL4|nr:hypothetical protein [Thauera linaloolentis]ENO88751.1 hypothetical protein C666_07985 [Thauera linaloolentis 47Lol = DSM 12138]MCM8564940.1 hypothetical protein [Thauera linaloolentis]